MAVLLRPFCLTPAPTNLQFKSGTRPLMSREQPSAAADFLNRSTTTTRSPESRISGGRIHGVSRWPGGASRISGALVTVDYFDVLGVRAALGRPFGRAADAGTAEPLVVLSDDTWRHHFAADPTVVNTRVQRQRRSAHGRWRDAGGRWLPRTGSGLGALEQTGAGAAPIDVAGDLLASRGVHYIKAIGRLRPGSTSNRDGRISRPLPHSRRAASSRATAVAGLRFGAFATRLSATSALPLLLLLGAVGLVLLIACANVASLLLARAASRQREIAIRAALGHADRLLRQLITESLVIGAAGGAGELLVGSWALTLLLKVMPQGIPRVQQIGLDMRVAIVALAASLTTAVL